jgi:ubiquinone/menaquinone biosynthesis C-methylase UbiE
MTIKTIHAVRGLMHDRVREQYEAYPYPARDPARELDFKLDCVSSRLSAIDQYIFGGRRNWSKPFRALVAGGGTGDVALHLASQMQKAAIPGAVVYLDISRAAKKVAEARAVARQLTNIEFRTGSLLDVSEAEFGLFDFIDCSGVLHHLEEPGAGLKALARVLGKHGGLNIMVYGRTGRAGVYELQRVARRLAPPSSSIEERLAVVRRLLAALPSSHLLKRGCFCIDPNADDAELVDLYLHARDQPFSVNELQTITQAAGLKIVKFLPGALYDIEATTTDPALIKAVSSLPPIDRAALVEDFGCRINKHIFCCVHESRTVPRLSPSDVDVVPVLISGSEDKPFDKAVTGQVVQLAYEYLQAKVRLNDEQLNILRLIDGRRTLRTIIRAIGGDQSVYRDAFAALYDAFNKMEIMHLRGVTE